jgi:hypothetical protein
MVCRAAQAAGKPLDEYLRGISDNSSALSGRPSIQSTSYGGHSASYFSPGQGGGMTSSDVVGVIDEVLSIYDCVVAHLEEELGRPPSPSEICSALTSLVSPGVSEIRNDFSMLRGCGCL